MRRLTSLLLVLGLALAAGTTTAQPKRPEVTAFYVPWEKPALASLGVALADEAVISNHRSTHHGDTLVVLSPEHAKMIAGEGWGKAEMRQFLWERLRTRVRDLIPGVDGGEGLPARVLAKFPHPESDDTLIPKFREPGNLKFLVAGGTAGRFSAVIPGWTFPKMSRLVIKAVHMP